MIEHEPRLDILMVDDNEVDLALFRHAVDQSGLNTAFQALTTGREAIDYLEAKGYYVERSKHPLPDVLVLDLKMPQLNGFDFLAWRKASGLYSAIPVVVLTGLADTHAIQRALDLGANMHIAKPDSLPGWNAVVRQICDLATKPTAAIP
jgi:CheY-like chemotaxis protein